MSQLRLFGSALRSMASPPEAKLLLRAIPHLSTLTTTASDGAGDSQDASAADPFLQGAQKEFVFGRMTGIGRNTLKTDVIHFFEGCNLSTDDVKIEYNRAYNPIAALLQFSSRSSYDKARGQTIRKGRLYKLDAVDQSQWDIAPSYDGKTVLLQGLPRSSFPEDIERFLSGCNFDPSSLQTFFRQGFPDPIKSTIVRFPTRLEAMNASCVKNRSFCLNSPVTIRVLE